MRAETAVALVGMMGSGKSTVGALLATNLGLRFVDSDEQVQQRTGRTVAAIFAADGEAAFREEETRALQAALAGGGNAVVSIAGGAVLAQANQALIEDWHGIVVWLRARPETLLSRVKPGVDHRPLLARAPAQTIRVLSADREPIYERLADLVVDVDDLTPEEIVERIVSSVR